MQPQCVVKFRGRECEDGCPLLTVWDKVFKVFIISDCTNCVCWGVHVIYSQSIVVLACITGGILGKLFKIHIKTFVFLAVPVG